MSFSVLAFVRLVSFLSLFSFVCIVLCAVRERNSIETYQSKRGVTVFRIMAVDLKRMLLSGTDRQ